MCEHKSFKESFRIEFYRWLFFGVVMAIIIWLQPAEATTAPVIKQPQPVRMITKNGLDIDYGLGAITSSTVRIAFTTDQINAVTQGLTDIKTSVQAHQATTSQTSVNQINAANNNSTNQINASRDGQQKTQIVTSTGNNWNTGSGTTTSSTLRVSANDTGFYNGTTLPEFASGGVVTKQASRRGTGFETLVDDENGRRMRIDSFNSLKVAEFTRLVGGSADGPIINTNVWTVQNSAGASVTQTGSTWLITTGTTANASASLTSIDRAPSISGLVNSYFSGVRIPDGGTANNERRWGAFTATGDGLYFKLDGLILSVCRSQANVESCTAQSSWNGPGILTDPFVLTTNFHTYEIHYTSGSARFWIDARMVHNITATTSALADTLHFPTRHTNQNKNGSTSNVQLIVRGNGIHRFGRPVGRPRATYFNTASTQVIKREAGTLHRLLVNRNGGLGNTTISIYDNTSATGTLIGMYTLPGNAFTTLEYDLDFNNGLTIVSSSGSQEITVVWE